MNNTLMHHFEENYLLCCFTKLNSMGGELWNFLVAFWFAHFLENSVTISCQSEKLLNLSH